MKRFLIRALLFFMVLSIIAASLDLLVSTCLKQSKTYASGEYSTWNDIYEGNVNSTIVIYGSSRAWVQIDPAIIQDGLGKTCYNLGLDGNNFWLQYFRHGEFLKHNTKPDLIIHSLDIFTLEKRTRLFNPDQFLPYMLLNTDIERLYRDYDLSTFPDFHFPMTRYAGERIAILHAFRLLLGGAQKSEGRVKGYEGQELQWNNDLQNAKMKMGSYVATVDSNTIHLFEKYLQECKTQGIEVILVYTPEYIEGQHFVTNRKAILDLYYQLSQKYSIPFFDYSNDSISYNKSFFYNSGHLNKQGSQLFTKKLTADILAGKK